MRHKQIALSDIPRPWFVFHYLSRKQIDFSAEVVLEVSSNSHSSVQTTERYIGCRQKFRDAVNDRFQVSLARTTR